MKTTQLILSVLLLAVSGNSMSEPPFSITGTSVSELSYNIDCDPERAINFGKARVTITHCIDSLGPDSDGMYQAYYDYETIILEMDNKTVYAKRYADTPEEASLIRIKDSTGERLLRLDDFNGDLIKTGISFLISNGAENIMYLDKSNQKTGYSSVPKDGV
jgi:hypothetical protein